MHFASQLYRLALRAYPPAFRLRYRGEMARVFEEGLLKARTAGARSTLRYCAGAASDLIVTAVYERLAAINRVSAGTGLLAIAAGSYASYVDFHASEVQATLLVLIATNFLLGCMAPNGAWRRALVIAALLPAIHLAVFALEQHASPRGHPYLSRILIFGPALVASLVGAYAGVFLRFIASRLAEWFAPHGGSGPGAVI